MSAPRPGMADQINDHALFGNDRQNHSLQMDLEERHGDEVTRVFFQKEHLILKCLADSSLRESYNKQVKKVKAVLEQDPGDSHVTFQERPLEVLRSLNANSVIHKILRSSKNSGGHRDQTNPEVRDQVDSETVNVAACSKETPAGKSEKVAKEMEVKLEAEQTPMVKKGQTNPEVPDAVDNETVDGYACSEGTPAGKSAKADNFKEVLPELRQMLMVEKDQTNPEVQDEVDNETVDDYACSKETPASKSEKTEEETLEAEQIPTVKKDQTIPEVPDEVDKETVDDYTFSDVTPAGMSAKVDNLNEVLLGLEQSKPMVKKVQSCLKALFLALEKMTQGFRAEEAQTGEVEKEAEEEKRRQRIKEVQSCLKALFLALEKMTQGFRAEEAQTGEVEKEAEEEKRRQRIKEGMSLLHTSAFVGQYKATLVLLMRHAASQTGDTLLHLDVQYGHTRLVKSLLDSLANCNLLNVSGHTSLYLACQHGYKDVVHLLLKLGQYQPFPGALQTPMHIAVKHGQVVCLRFLIQYSYAVDTKGMSEAFLQKAFLYGKPDVVRYLLEVGADMLALSGLDLAPLDVVNHFTVPRSSQNLKKALLEFFTPGTMNAFHRSDFDSFLAWFSLLLKQKEAEVSEVCLQGYTQTDMTEAQTDERQLWQDEKRQIHMKNGLLLYQLIITVQDEHSSYSSERVPVSIFVYNESFNTLLNTLLLLRVWRDICDGKSPDPGSCRLLALPILDMRVQLPDEVKNKLKSRLRLALRFIKENADLLRQYNKNVDASEDHNRNMAIQRCLGLLQRAYQIVSKEQKLNDYCAFDELADCMEVYTAIYECSELLKSVIDLNTRELEVDRFKEAYARVRQSFADIRRNVERWRDAVLHSTVALFSKGSFNSTVRQLMNRNVATFGKGGNGELVEAFQSGQHLIVKKTLLRESEWSIATEMSHPNVMPWLALICGGRSDSKPGQIVSYQIMPKMTEDLSASIRKMGGSIHHYILQLQESEEPNAVLSARADLVRLRGAEILRRVLLGLDYMHQRNVVHRDIKGSNILLKKPVDCPHEAVHTCTCPGGWEVRVADFDSMIHLGVARDRARRRKQLKVGNTGTSGYRASEVFYESSTSDINDPDYYSPASDIWSFGGVCLHLAMGFCCPRMQYQVSLMTLAHHRMVNIPAEEAQEKVDRTTGIYHIRQGFTGEKWLDMVNFTARPLEVDSSKRPSARSLLQDTYLEQACPLQTSFTDQTVEDEPCSEGTPASKSEKAAKEKDVKLEAEQTPVVKNDQTILEVRDEVDNETVDDEGSSEEMPAGKSEKAAKEKEVQLEAEQTPMVKKDCAPKDDSTLHEPQTSIDLDSDKRFSDRSHTAQCPATPQSLQPKPNAKQEAASQTEMLSTRSPTSDETVWGGTTCSDISDEAKQEGEGQDDRCANGPPVGRGESSESAESSNSGDSKSNESSEVGERSRESLCTTPYAAEDSRYPDSLVGYVSLKDCRMQCCTKSYTGDDRLTSYTSYVSTDSLPVTEDGSDSELEYSHQSCPLQTNPGDVINTMLSDHNECCAEKAAGLEGINPPCQSVQENPCLRGSQSSHEVVCMHLKPIPQELRKAIVTGQYANREWLTLTLRSNTGTACMSVVCHGEDGDKDSDDEDSKDRKRKAMDRLRRENKEKQKKQNTANLNKGFDTDNHSPRASSAPAHSDLRSNTSDGPNKQQAVRKGQVVLSKVNHVFREGSFVPLPSQEALAKGIGKGGNGVVGFIYHGRREFAVKETCLRQEELETWSSVSHPNVIEICAVIEGDWDAVYPGTRICYQMMPRVTGDIKSMLEEKEMPTLCHYFYDFKEDSERAGLVLGNAKYILLSVLNGLKHLHSLGIMHRDIKLQNILVDRHCQCTDIFQCPHYGDTGYGVLISDFDSALRVDRGREKLERSKLHGQPIKYSVHGTPGYRPPETSFPMSCNDVLPEWISLKTDIWSFGTMLVKFLVGSRGPHSQREMATLLLADCLQCPTAANRPRGVRISPLQALAVEATELKTLQKVALLEKYFPLATELHRLVQSCLTVNVEERPSAEQVMEKAFFRSISEVPKSQPASSTPAAEKEQAVGAH